MGARRATTRRSCRSNHAADVLAMSGAASASALWYAHVNSPVSLPGGETSAGWQADERNPVFGQGLGSCFDPVVLLDGGRYRLWFSWRPRGSVAYSESADGVQWSAPLIALAPDPATRWEDEVNRGVVVRRSDGYHLWYTGQARGRSAIGHAVSSDGWHGHARARRHTYPGAGMGKRRGHVPTRPLGRADSTVSALVLGRRGI